MTRKSGNRAFGAVIDADEETNVDIDAERDEESENGWYLDTEAVNDGGKREFFDSDDVKNPDRS